MKTTQLPDPCVNYAGYVCTRRNKLTTGWNVLLKANLAGLDPAGGNWVCVCETHGALCNFESKALALRHLSSAGWCEDCRELEKLPTITVAGIYTGLPDGWPGDDCKTLFSWCSHPAYQLPDSTVLVPIIMQRVDNTHECVMVHAKFLTKDWDK